MMVNETALWNARNVKIRDWIEKVECEMKIRTIQLLEKSCKRGDKVLKYEPLLLWLVVMDIRLDMVAHRLFPSFSLTTNFFPLFYAHPTYHNKQYQSYLSLQLLMHFEFAGGLKTHNKNTIIPPSFTNWPQQLWKSLSPQSAMAYTWQHCQNLKIT